MTWEKPAGPVTGYRIYCFPGESQQAEIIKDIYDCNLKETIISGLRPETEYRVGITSISVKTESYCHESMCYKLANWCTGPCFINDRIKCIFSEILNTYKLTELGQIFLNVLYKDLVKIETDKSVTYVQFLYSMPCCMLKTLIVMCPLTFDILSFSKKYWCEVS